MTDTPIRAAYSLWPLYNHRVRATAASLSAEQLSYVPGRGRWPLWATFGHMACQRVSGLCGLAGEPGAETTPFPNALYVCPGDEDLEHVLGPAELAHAFDSTFRIIENCLDTWTLEMLDEEVRFGSDGEEMVFTRGNLLQRSFTHDIWHAAEINEALVNLGLPSIDFWD